MQQGDIIKKIDSGEIKIAKLEVIVSHHEGMLQEIRNSLRTMPEELKKGFKEIVGEIRNDHKEEFDLLKQQIQKINENPIISYFLWVERNPSIGRIVTIAIIIAFFTIVISDFRKPFLNFFL